MSQVDAPAVIIPPQHQSAPKDPPCFNVQPTFAPDGATSQFLDGTVHRAPDLSDMDGPALDHSDPRIQKQMAEFQAKIQREQPCGERLDAIEEAIRQRERSCAASAGQRWKGQERWQGRENEEARLVRIMHPHTFIRMLRKAGVDARLEESKHARIWLNEWSRVGRIGVNAWIQRQAMTVTTLQYPYGPEYTIMRFNEYDVPTNEKYRGWRTALLCLIIAGVISEDEAERAFGPATGPASQAYREQLYEHRAMRMGLVQ